MLQTTKSALRLLAQRDACQIIADWFSAVPDYFLRILSRAMNRKQAMKPARMPTKGKGINAPLNRQTRPDTHPQIMAERSSLAAIFPMSTAQPMMRAKLNTFQKVTYPGGAQIQPRLNDRPVLIETTAASSVSGRNNWLQTNALIGHFRPLFSPSPGFKSPAERGLAWR